MHQNLKEFNLYISSEKKKEKKSEENIMKNERGALIYANFIPFIVAPFFLTVS